MVFWPPNHGILTPFLLYFDPPTHGISIPHPWYFEPIPMVYRTPTDGISPNWKTCRIFLNTVHTNKRKNCIVTVFDPNTKHILLTRGIEIRNRYIKFVDVEKQVTNITMKDAPCELSNQVICAFMQKIGEMVQGSLHRGLIKGTHELCFPYSNYEKIREIWRPNIRRQQQNWMSILLTNRPSIILLREKTFESSFVISPISGNLLFLSISASLPSWMSWL
jgi:hypothetical protein